MAQFPFGTSTPLAVFSLLFPPDFEPAPITLAAFHAAMEAYVEACRSGDFADGQLFKSRVPPDLRTTAEEVWGWSWPDDENPTSAGRWLVWCMRQWTKKIPGRLRKALIEDRCQKYVDSLGLSRCPRDQKAAITEATELELRASMPPEVADAPIVLDVTNHRLLIIGQSEAFQHIMLTRATALLRRVYGATKVEFVPWTLEEYFKGSRPKEVLPGEIGERWLTWLADRAVAGEWATYETGPVPRYLRLSLDDKARIVHGDGTVSADGSEACAHLLGWAKGDEGGELQVSRLSLRVERKDTFGLELALDPDGNILGCSLVGAPKYSAVEDHRMTASFDRAEAFMEVAELVRLLMYAFDSGPLQQLIDGSPQLQMWRDERAPVVTWSTEEPLPGVNAPREETPLERSAWVRKQLGIPEPAPPADPEPGTLRGPPIEVANHVELTSEGASAPLVFPEPNEEQRAEIIRLWKEVGQMAAITYYREAKRCSIGAAYDPVRAIVGAVESASDEDAYDRELAIGEADRERKAAAQLVRDAEDDARGDGTGKTTPPLDDAFTARLKQLWADKREGEAVALYKNTAKCSMKEAKAAVMRAVGVDASATERPKSPRRK